VTSRCLSSTDVGWCAGTGLEGRAGGFGNGGAGAAANVAVTNKPHARRIPVIARRRIAEGIPQSVCPQDSRIARAMTRKQRRAT